MHGDFTRWTFSPRHGYRSVLMQQGRVLLDADWNEQAEIIAHHDHMRTKDSVGVSGGPADAAGFAITAVDGSEPREAAWGDLRIAPGQFYVDGVLVEAVPPPTAGPAPFRGWPLGDQPHVRPLPKTPPAGVPGEKTPSVEEPPDGTYAAVLDVWTHHVTADELPSLREPALGSPDTTTRAQTVWQVRLIDVDPDATCTDLHTSERSPRALGHMVAQLREAAGSSDPCRITASGGYQRLENQLYRVEIHQAGPGPATFLWSRENGSVVAGLTGLDNATAPGMAELTLDRVGRDEELSIGEGDTVEITSVDRQLRELPGFVATAEVPTGLRLPVRWADPEQAPTDLAQLGRTPLIRRWEGPPRSVSSAPQDLEDGLQVGFPDDGVHATGNYWLIPARTTRQVYGMTAQAGTIDWPTAGNAPLACPPLGPRHHLTPLAILVRDGGRWTLRSDCRRLFPSLTELVTLNLLGGDGQEALPGVMLPQPVRVAVRNGGRPVAGARVRFTTSGGQVTGTDGVLVDEAVVTGPDGVAAVKWALAKDGGTTQTMEVRLLDGPMRESAALTVTGRLSVASQIAWAPAAGCAGLSGEATVQAALERLAGGAELRLLGGDGQHLRAPARVLPQPVRVIVDSACGPVGGRTVTASSVGQGGIVKAKASGESTAPAELQGGASADAVTAGDGSAAFWWQPDPAALSSTLTIALQGDTTRAPVTVTAQALAETGGPAAPVTANAVTWAPPASCTGFAAVGDVKDALDKLVLRAELRLLGGDGQHLRAPAKVLPQPVRVIVDSACGPVGGRTVTASSVGQGGIVKAKASGESTAPAELQGGASADAVTAGDGSAAFWWQPDPAALSSTLTIALQGDTTRAPVTVTAQAHPTTVSANSVTWTPQGACAGFSGVGNVKTALDTLVAKAELRLLGGDGQQLRYGLPVLPEPVRVVVDSPCGPVSNQTVTATAGPGALVRARSSTETTAPSGLQGAAATANAPTGADGSVAFWWQPDPSVPTDTLSIGIAGDTSRAPVTVTAQTSRTPGVHIAKIAFVDNTVFENDKEITCAQLASGIRVTLDGDIDPTSVTGKPVLHVFLDLPWPVSQETTGWTVDKEIALRAVEITQRSKITAESRKLTWSPPVKVSNWIKNDVRTKLPNLHDQVIQGRLVIDGWAITTTGASPKRYLNCHAAAETTDAGGQAVTRLVLPTDNEVMGGTFVQWFTLKA
ncbi:DUF6519 domain-containing protein [Streptomyces sp. NPDC007808]|uniref:DUF6519 domain-containing protein n=1 Tax=Streptomyces sp. NPDC007808 TaxID=3364779 RepID=UPI0036876D94